MASRFWPATPGRTYVGRLATGTDLVDEIEAFCLTNDIRAAWVSVVGAVRRCSFAYYDQADLQYLPLASEHHHEIAGFIGNISMRDGRPFLHAHASFGDRDGRTVSGHLLRGCEVFVAEVNLREMTGIELERTPDELTGLALW